VTGKRKNKFDREQTYPMIGRVPLTDLAITPHVIESLIKLIKLQLSLKARANHVIEV
jgi:hypothetical protein